MQAIHSLRHPTNLWELAGSVERSQSATMGRRSGFVAGRRISARRLSAEGVEELPGVVLGDAT